MPLCMELTMAEDSPHTEVINLLFYAQSTITIISGRSPMQLCSKWQHFSVALVFLVVSVCCDSPSLSVLGGVNVLWQPKP